MESLMQQAGVSLSRTIGPRLDLLDHGKKCTRVRKAL